MSARNRAPDWVQLTADEEVVWEGHPSMHRMTGELVVAVLLVAAGVALARLTDPPVAWVGIGLVVVALLVAAAGYVRLQSTQYVVTTREVYKKTGILSRRVTNLRHDRIQNTVLEQSLFERLLSYGDIHIETAGTGHTELVLEAVPDPQRINGLLAEQLDALAAGGGAGERST